MPKWVEDCVKAMMAKGTPEDKAWPICQAQYKKQAEKFQEAQMKLSFDDLNRLVREAVDKKFGNGTWVQELYEGRCVIEQEGRLYEVAYTLSKDESEVTVGDRGPEVKRDYVPLAELTDVEIFEAGTYRGTEYTESDIENMVRNFNNLGAKIQPTMVVGHSEDQKLLKNSGIFSAGWVKSLRKVGSKLVADFRDVPEVLASLIKKGAYKRISSEIYENYKDGGQAVGRALRRVAILGGEIPEVKTLQDVAALYAEDQPARWVNFDERDAKINGREENSMDEVTKLKEELDAEKKARKTAEDKAAEAATRFSEQEKAQAKSRIKTTLDKLTEEGKLAPAGRPAIEEFMEALSGQDVVVKFSDGKEKTLLEKFEETVLSGLGTVVKLGEEAKTETGEPADKLSEETRAVNAQLGIDDETYKKFAEKA